MLEPDSTSPLSPRVARRGLRSLAGLGAVGAVLALAGTALATVPLTQISEDPYTNTSSYHRTQVEPDSFSFGSTIVAAFQTGRFSNGGASNTGWSTSTDGGDTWTNGFLPATTVYANPPGPWARISDPAVAYDPQHDVWMILGLTLNDSLTGKAVVVSRSTDGGLSWGNPVTVAVASGFQFFDKTWMVCDTWASSPNLGNCYVQWDDFGSGNRLRMARSTDGGLTWTNASTPNRSVIGGQPVVQPTGRVVVPIDDGFESQVQSFVSNDGGQTYSGPFTVANIQSHSVAGGLRTGPLPSAEVDGSGTVYVVWQDCRFRSSCRSNDIVMSTSTDGRHWSPVTRIPTDPTTSSVDHFIPGIGVDTSTSGATAHIGLAYYVYREASCTTSTCRLGVAYVSSTDGGATWSKQKVLLGPLNLRWLPNTTLGYMVGDYISTSIIEGRAFPVVANATEGNCQLGQITSCHEFMVVPTGGLPVAGGPIAAGRERPATRAGAGGAARLHTAN